MARQVPRAYDRLAGLFDAVAVSDIAWQRVLPWRHALARLWPGIGRLRDLRVQGPRADAHLLAGWLRSRLDREVRLSHEAADELQAVAVDGEEVPAPELERAGLTASDLLSNELDVFGRDPVYEAAVRSLTPASV